METQSNTQTLNRPNQGLILQTSSTVSSFAAYRFYFYY